MTEKPTKQQTKKTTPKQHQQDPPQKNWQTNPPKKWKTNKQKSPNNKNPKPNRQNETSKSQQVQVFENWMCDYPKLPARLFAHRLVLLQSNVTTSWVKQQSGICLGTFQSLNSCAQPGKGETHMGTHALVCLWDLGGILHQSQPQQDMGSCRGMFRAGAPMCPVGDERV